MSKAITLIIIGLILIIFGFIIAFSNIKDDTYRITGAIIALSGVIIIWAVGCCFIFVEKSTKISSIFFYETKNDNKEIIEHVENKEVYYSSNV